MVSKKSRREFFKSAGWIGTGLAVDNAGRGAARATSIAASDVSGLTNPPLDVVRVGMIGAGIRGTAHVGRLLRIEGVTIQAVCDPYEPVARRTQQMCAEQGRPEPAVYSKGDLDYKRMLERDDLDVVLICTPWRWHVRQAVDTMNAGKHAFVEVPAAITVDECWQLVEAAESTLRHCMMMENVCYGRAELMVLNMCRQGILGELLHGEAAYLHDLRFQMKDIERGTGSWRTRHHSERNGNLYPTHGLGPVAQYLNINRGDRFEYLTSMSTPARGRALYASKNFPPDHSRNRAKYICGDINTSLIKTVLGRTIVLQHDTTSPRPYDRVNLIQGTRGMFRGYPNRITVEGRADTHQWADISSYSGEFDHPLWKRLGKKATAAGGHGGMDFVMLWRMIYCLRNGQPLDQDVYDAASWSVVSPLSERSVANRSEPVDVPDFTRGKWKTMKPLGIVA